MGNLYQIDDIVVCGMEGEERIYVGKQKELELIAAISSFFYGNKNLKQKWQMLAVLILDSRWVSDLAILLCAFLISTSAPTSKKSPLMKKDIIC